MLGNTQTTAETDEALSHMSQDQLLSSSTFHKVFPDRQAQLHNRILEGWAQPDTPRRIEAVRDRQFENDDWDTHFVVVWNCSDLASPATTSSSSSSLSSSSSSSSSSLSSSSSYGGVCQQSALTDPVDRTKPSVPASHTENGEIWAEWWYSLSDQAKRRLRDLHDKNVIFVGLTHDSAADEETVLLSRFFTSLRRTGSTAHVVLFAHSETIEIAKSFLDSHRGRRGRRGGDEEGGAEEQEGREEEEEGGEKEEERQGDKVDLLADHIVLIPWHADAEKQSFTFSDNSATTLFDLWWLVMNRCDATFRRILHITTLNVLFTADPFATIPSRGGLEVFVPHQNDYFTGHFNDAQALRKKFGVCGLGGYLETHPFYAQASPSVQVVMGTHDAYENFLGQIVTNMRQEIRGDRPCSPLHMMSRLVWDQFLAIAHPLTIFDFVDGPVARIDDKELMQQLREIDDHHSSNSDDWKLNHAKRPYAIVLFGPNQYEHHY